MVKEDDFEEFQDEEEFVEEPEEDEEQAPAPAVKQRYPELPVEQPRGRGKPPVKQPVRQDMSRLPEIRPLPRLREEEPRAKPEIRYVAVPRAVPVETMLNEMMDTLQEVKQLLMAELEKEK